MFTFVIGISCGNTPFVQKHESTTHVNGFVFDSIFSVGKYFVRTFHVLTVSASQNQFLSQKREHPLTFNNFEESFSFVQALLANKAPFLYSLSVFSNENTPFTCFTRSSIARTSAIVFGFLRKPASRSQT